MLLYNYLLAKKKGLDDKVDEFQEEIFEWIELIKSREHALSMWNINQFWQTVCESGRVPSGTQAFVNRWLKMIFGSSWDIQITENKRAQELIQTREYELKRGRSRFENARRLEVWNGRSGTAPLNYRWPVASNMIDDIVNGLQGH